MNRSALFIIIGVLVIALVVLGIAYQGEVDEGAQLNIEAGENGISIEVDD